ncbi:transporter, partial [Acinetobacter soli]|uniref:transporter n=1 Tax=Acinetobacter soli TaxID=487316 RepID=UPI00208FE253
TASNEPTGTTIALSGYVTAPTGDYDVGKVNIGTGTWVLTPQIHPFSCLCIDRLETVCHQISLKNQSHSWSVH